MAAFDNLCMNCMADIGENTKCPYCGFQKNKRQTENALPFRSLLKGRYVAGRVKKINGEGFTYIAYDTERDVPVELHEFFPQSLSYRDGETGDIRITGGKEVEFDRCFTKFINNANKINKLQDVEAITHVTDVFEANHTAYAAFEWVEHVTLRYFTEHSGGKLGWNAVRRLFMPVLSALCLLHGHGISHLGISPDTLFITGDGQMVLSGFAIDSVRCVQPQSAPDLVPGFAAIEQYVAGSTPGEPTDVYGFAASMLFALTGKPPADSKKRRANSRLPISNSVLRTLPENSVTALADALQVSPENRTQTFVRLKTELLAETGKKAPESRRDAGVPAAKRQKRKRRKEVPNFVWVLSSCIIMLAVFAVIGFFWAANYHNGAQEQRQSDAEVVSAAASSAAVSGGLTAASGGTISAPDLVGQNYNKLVSSSSASSGAADYQVLLSSKQFSDTMPEGCIISQDPLPNSEMSKGTAVVVVVSEGAAVRTLPAVTGKTLSEASALVTAEGFVPTKDEEYSETVPKGYAVGYKDVKEGDEKPYGSQVVIVVSKGPAETESTG